MTKFHVTLRREEYEEIIVEAEDDKQAKRLAESEMHSRSGSNEWFAVTAKLEEK